jgi:hypothetical protein
MLEAFKVFFTPPIPEFIVKKDGTIFLARSGSG